MIVMSFDLSSSVIGIVVAEVKSLEVTRIKSCPVIPPKFDPSTLGFLKAKKRISSKKRESTIMAYLKPGEETITVAEKRKRDSQVRNEKDLYIMAFIGKTLQELIQGVKPDVILVEKNIICNGVLTSVLLAKVMGSLLGIAGGLSIPVKEFTVAEVRKKFNMAKLTAEFAKDTPEEELKTIPDIGKAALAKEMKKKYNADFKTYDESDACVILDHWLHVEREKRA